MTNQQRSTRGADSTNEAALRGFPPVWRTEDGKESKQQQQLLTSTRRLLFWKFGTNSSASESRESATFSGKMADLFFRLPNSFGSSATALSRFCPRQARPPLVCPVVSLKGRSSVPSSFKPGVFFSLNSDQFQQPSFFHCWLLQERIPLDFRSVAWPENFPSAEEKHIGR